MGDGKQKYRLGLKPISEDKWLNRKIGPNLYSYKKKLLDNNYNNVVAVTMIRFMPKKALSEKFSLKESIYNDLIADLSLLIQDDLCLIRANANQELLAASICSPSYWNVKSKIGKPLREIHQPVTTLNEKIGDRISTFIKQAPLMKPFCKTKLVDSRRYKKVSSC